MKKIVSGIRSWPKDDRPREKDEGAKDEEFALN